jgi:hypothetical protein
MNEFREVELKEYNYDTNENESRETVSLYLLAKNLKVEHLARLLENWLNSYDRAAQRGRVIGEAGVRWHRTLQGTLVNFALGILVGYAKKYQEEWGGHTDPRNETAFKAAGIVASLVEDGTIPLQPFI